MVFRLDSLPETEVEDAARAIVVQEGSVVEKEFSVDNDVASIWKSPVNQEPNLIAYWMGPAHENTTNVLAYRIAELTGLPDGRRALEMKRAWVCPGLRGKGLSSALMRAMAKHERACLLADRDGVTASGYELWEKSAGWQRSYWDQSEMTVVTVESVPAAERFAQTQAARRWALVLQTAPSISDE